MPRLNLRKTAGKPSSLKKGKVTGAKLTPFALKSNGKDDDISSDEEEDIMESGKKRKVSTEAEEEEEEEEEKYAYETAEEKRRRLAQQYLKNISKLESEDEEGDSDEDDTNGGVYQSISEKLKRERLKSQGRWAVELAPQFEAVNFQEDTVTSHYGGYQGSITSLSVTQDESFIVTGSKDNAVIRFDTETGHRQILKRKWQRALDGDNQSHHGEILAVAVTSDGKYVASGGRDRIVRIHDSRMENSEIHTFSAHRDAITGLCFQTGTFSLFSSSFDRCIKYFDLNEMAYVETAFGHQDAVLSIDCWHKLRPLTSSADRTNRHWKIEENSHLVFRGHKAQIDTARILSDSTFVSGGEDGKLCLWDHGKKTPVSTIAEAHGTEELSPRWITSVSTIRACDVVASGSYDGFVRLWSVTNNVSGSAGKLNALQAVPMPGFVNGLHISSRLLIAGCGREHRFGRWWNLKNGAKDRLTVIRFKTDLAESQNASQQNGKIRGYAVSSDEEGMNESESDEESEEDDD